jgi:hypothetical protein
MRRCGTGVVGTKTWPACCAAAITAEYGILKGYWVIGGTALWSMAPLPEEMIEEARWRRFARGAGYRCGSFVGH